MVLFEIRKNAYYDSVTLMLISKQVADLDGVEDVLVGMATELNLDLADNFGLGGAELKELTPNDFFVAAKVKDEEAMKQLVAKVDELLNSKKQAAEGDIRPRSLNSAVDMLHDANLVLISVAGQYAAQEADAALDKNLHVMIFSDNVSKEDELRLKKKAVEKNLLLMGPDCGTAMINGVCLAFANVVARGPIGIVGASGTGTQEIMCLVDKKGGGLSQVIGTGGRDLSEDIGGLMMIQGLEALLEDEETEVIVLVSKPPAASVEEKILDLVKTSKKPVVIDFIGGDPDKATQAGAVAAVNLEDAAAKAVALSKGQEVVDWAFDEGQWKALAQEKLGKLKPEQKYLRGFYTGGTLADEAIKLLSKPLGALYSNIPFESQYKIVDTKKLEGHVVLDLGDDQFTVGRPHPMIDPQTRTEFFESGVCEQVAVLLMDVVLGYGSHEDPAGEAAASLKKIKERFPDREFIAVASVTGTTGDPQGLEQSEKTLKDAGALVFDSNAQAVSFVKLLFAEMEA